MNTEALEKLIKEYKSMLAHCKRELACATSEKMESYYEGKIITYEVVLRDLKKCVSNNACLESAKCNKHGVTNRTYKCSRCGTEYIPVSGIVKAGCCIMPVDYRTSGICGGELIEVT